MIARPLDFAFAPMTPPIAREGMPPLRLSIRAPDLVPHDEQMLELVLEQDRRRATYPRLVTAGRMTQDEADRHRAILARLIEDCRDDFPPLDNPGFDAAYGAWQAAARASPWRWDHKVRELRREIALRRNTYARAIATDRTDEAEARQRMERMEAVHWRYWVRHHAIDFGPAPFGDGPPWTMAEWRRFLRARDHEIDLWLRELRRQDHPAVAHLDLSAPAIDPRLPEDQGEAA